MGFSQRDIYVVCLITYSRQRQMYVKFRRVTQHRADARAQAHYLIRKSAISANLNKSGTEIGDFRTNNDKMSILWRDYS